MARTKEEIKQVIIDRLQVLIPELTSTSATAIYQLLADAFASATNSFEQLTEVELQTIETLLFNNQYGTKQQTIQSLLKFQNGDVLEWDSETGTFGYATIDESKQIIKRVAVEEQESGFFIIKAAKIENGEIVELEAAEKTNAEAYLDNTLPVGSDWILLSEQADVLDATVSITYRGEFGLDNIKTALKTALDDFLQDNTSLESFSGTFLLNSFIDAMREVEGINDAVVSFLSFTDFIPETSIIVETVGEDIIIKQSSYKTAAGYFAYAGGTQALIDSWTYKTVEE